MYSHLGYGTLYINLGSGLRLGLGLGSINVVGHVGQCLDFGIGAWVGGAAWFGAQRGIGHEYAVGRHVSGKGCLTVGACAGNGLREVDKVFSCGVISRCYIRGKSQFVAGGIDGKQTIVVEHNQGVELIAGLGLRVVGKGNTLCERHVVGVVAHLLKIAVAECVGTFDRGCIFIVAPLKEHEVSVFDAVLVVQTIVECGAAAAVVVGRQVEAHLDKASLAQVDGV